LLHTHDTPSNPRAQALVSAKGSPAFRRDEASEKPKVDLKSKMQALSFTCTSGVYDKRLLYTHDTPSNPRAQVPHKEALLSVERRPAKSQK
jgi:hypothetical protein